MQFQYNSDYPGTTTVTNTTGATTANHTTAPPTPADASPPGVFPPVQPIPCARITTRIFHPSRQQVATVNNVLVRTQIMQKNNSNAMQGSGNSSSSSSSSSSMSSHFSDDSDSDDDDDLMSDDEGNNMNATTPTANAAAAHNTPNTRQQRQNAFIDPDADDRAYWIQRTIREAIYGRVWVATVLRRRKTLTGRPNDNAVWEVTNYQCAVKEMSWQHIRKEQHRLAEDPIKEVAAMQYLQQWYCSSSSSSSNGDSFGNFDNTSASQSQHSSSFQNYESNTAASIPTMDNTQNDTTSTTFNPNITTTPNNNTGIPPNATPNATQNHHADGVARSFRAMRQTNLMMPLDLLSDDRNLYSIMPFCDGGELFERLDLNERFPEAEARYWMRQILNGIENLQNAGICHRDMSLENLLVHQNGALVIDMGMCLRVPFQTGTIMQQSQSQIQEQPIIQPNSMAAVSQSLGDLSMNGGGGGGGVTGVTATPAAAGFNHNNTNSNAIHNPIMPIPPNRRTPRFLIQPQGTCGKWIYMSPEIYRNKENFDGFAVDMWAVGVILFLMLTGFPPWERACATDERFKYMTAGYLVQMLTEWDLGISPDGMDLLQRMLFLDPKDRLSLDQVRSHPWMVKNDNADATVANAMAIDDSSGF